MWKIFRKVKMALPSSYFFDLSCCEHASLFQENLPPWLILQQLASYLHSQVLGVHRGNVSPQAYLINPEQISIGEGSIIEPGAYIQGPCLIGKHCVIRHGAYIRGNVLTGDHCIIGHDSELKHAILLNHASAAHFAYVGDSILGNHVNLGAGVKCANFKLNHTPVSLQINGQRIATHMRKLGAIIGDHSQIGCNTVANPGTLLGQAVHCYPNLNIEGFIPSRSLIKPQTKPVVTSY